MSGVQGGDLGGQGRKATSLTLSPQLLSKWLHVFNDNPKLEHMSSMERDQILFQEMTLVQKKDIFQIEIAST